MPDGGSGMRSKTDSCAASPNDSRRNAQQEGCRKRPCEPFIRRTQPLLGAFRGLEMVDLFVDLLQGRGVRGAEVLAARLFRDGLEGVFVEIGVAPAHGEK